nr:heme ABC transporter ATP-binding protein [uncultured Sellimonas sp.]
MNLSAEHLCLSYGNDKILKDVSIDVNSKEFVGIIGPNGSGKSTLLKCIYRTLSPDTGCVYLGGDSLKKLSYKDSAKKISVVAQHNYYNFEFTVREVVLMGRAPHKKVLERDTAQDYKIVQQALQKVGMKEFADRDFSTLSGGEQQRVILARALAQQTPCLVLDEPTNHLDITHQLQLMKIVKELDVTVVAAIHDLNIAAMFCDRLYVLKDGEIVAGGNTQEVLTKELIRDVYGVETEIAEDSKGRKHILYTI